MSFFTIYFHKDFDGFIAASLFLRINDGSQLIGADSISLKPVDYDLKNKWLIMKLDRPNAVIDFLYHPQADWWFDHHVSTFLKGAHKNRFSNSEKQTWDLYQPSCAALIKKSLQHHCSLFMCKEEYDKITEDFKDWIYWSDIIDNAKYESPAQIVNLENPCLQINATLSADVDEDYLRHLILAAKNYRPAEVAKTTLVKDRIEKAAETQEMLMSAFKKNYKILPPNTVFFDYAFHNIPFQRYLSYYYEPDAQYTVGIYPRSGKFALSVGKNPWLDFQSKNLGEICQKFGGGGRINVGSALFTKYEDALEAVNITIGYLLV